MHRMTVFLPADLKLNLERAARVTERSEADLILEGIRQVVAAYAGPRPRPRIPLFRSNDPTLAERADE